MPRGDALGLTLYVPEADRHLYPRSYFLDRIAVALGGRVAEELVFGDITNGAGSDIQKVTQMARSMVTRFGMSDKMGPLQFGRQNENVFLGREISEQRDYSEEVAEQVDEEVRRIVHEAYERVREMLSAHRAQLEAVAQALLERETLLAEEFVAIFEGQIGPEDLADPLAPQPA